MAFDLSTAKPVTEEYPPKTKKFDLSTAKPVSKPSFFDSPAARLLFPGTGGAIGTVVGGGLSAGTAALPAATLGAMGGESVRQNLASWTGGGPHSMPEAINDMLWQGAFEASGPALGQVAGTTTRTIGRGLGATGRYIYRNISEPTLNYARQRFQQGVNLLTEDFQSPQVLLGSIGKLRTAIQKVAKVPPSPPSPKVLYPVAEKASSAFEAVRESMSSQYQQVAEAAQIKPVRVSMVNARKILEGELRQKGLLLEKGSEVLPLTGDERLLRNVYGDFQSVSPRPIEGLPEATQAGTFMNYQTARRFIDRMDEAIAGASTRNTKRILIETKRQLVNGLKSADEELSKVIPGYSEFVGLRDVFEDVVSNPDKAVAILQMAGKETRQGLGNQLQRLSELAPEEFKFMDDLLQYQKSIQRVELAKQAPKSLSKLLRGVKTDEELEHLIKNIHDLPETTKVELEALEQSTGIPFLQELRDIAAARAFRGLTPQAILGLGSAGLLGLLGRSMGWPGAIGGALTGIAMSSPRMQGEALRRGTQLVGGVNRLTRPLRPLAIPGITTLLRLTGNAAMEQE